MNYKVKHKYTGLYYQPTTASGSNMGKKERFIHLRITHA